MAIVMHLQVKLPAGCNLHIFIRGSPDQGMSSTVQLLKGIDCSMMVSIDFAGAFPSAAEV